MIRIPVRGLRAATDLLALVLLALVLLALVAATAPTIHADEPRPAASAEPATVGDRIAPLIGAGAGEVVVGDSTSVSLFRVVAAGLGLQPGRNVIVTERGNFPSDLYIL